MKMKPYKNIDEYISGYPNDVRAILERIRKTVSTVAPGAKEKISYGIPTFTLNGNLVHFAAYENHIGFYPGAGAIVEFENELKSYGTSKGTIRFPLDKPIKYDLIKKITKYRVRQSLAKS